MFEKYTDLIFGGKIKWIKVSDAEEIAKEIIDGKDKEIEKLKETIKIERLKTVIIGLGLKSCTCDYPVDACNGTQTCTYCSGKLSMQQLLEINKRQPMSYNNLKPIK